jgi:DNA-binding ferritin-like protein (Dps family)
MTSKDISTESMGESTSPSSNGNWVDITSINTIYEQLTTSIIHTFNNTNNKLIINNILSTTTTNNIDNNNMCDIDNDDIFNDYNTMIYDNESSTMNNSTDVAASHDDVTGDSIDGFSDILANRNLIRYEILKYCN